MKLLFDHLRKTGGTSVITVLKRFLGPDNVTWVYGENAGTVCRRLPQTPALAGHMYFNPSETLPKECYCLTILRDPIDRILSAYYFNRNNVPSGASATYAQLLDLTRYIESSDEIVRDELENLHTNHYYPLSWNGQGSLSDADKLAAAKRSLEQYQLVGVFEDLTDFIDVLCYEQGWPPVLDPPRINVTVRRPKVEDVPSAVRKRLTALNELDIELLQHARKLFSAHRRRIIVACIHERTSALSSHRMPEKRLLREDWANQACQPLPAKSLQKTVAESDIVELGDRALEIISVRVISSLSGTASLLSGENATIRVQFAAREETDDLTVGILVHDESGRACYGTNSRQQGWRLSVGSGGEYVVDFVFRVDLGMGSYSVTAALHTGRSHVNRCFHWRDNAASFDVIGVIGYEFSGTARLYPTVTCSSIYDAGKIEQHDATGVDSGFRLLTHLSPVLTEFAATIRSLRNIPAYIGPSQTFEIELEVTNTSRQPWPSIGLRPVCISYHWFHADGSVLVYDGKRTRLPRDVESGGTIRHWVTILAPEEEGPARLHVSLVQEHVAWFEDQGVKPLELLIEVRQRAVQAEVDRQPQPR